MTQTDPSTWDVICPIHIIYKHYLSASLHSHWRIQTALNLQHCPPWLSHPGSWLRLVQVYGGSLLPHSRIYQPYNLIADSREIYGKPILARPQWEDHKGGRYIWGKRGQELEGEAAMSTSGSAILKHSLFGEGEGKDSATHSKPIFGTVSRLETWQGLSQFLSLSRLLGFSVLWLTQESSD